MVTARDGLEAIEKAVLEDVRLVILDVMMPRMNGYQACRLLKTEPATRDLPVVILTSRDQAGDRFWGLETGADYYITKDSEPHRILELVKNILAGDAAGPRPAAGGRPADQRRHPLPGQRAAGPQALRGHDPLRDRTRGARASSSFDETFTSVMGLVARVVDFTVGAMAFVEGDELDVVLMLHRHARPGGGRGGQGPAAGRDRARARGRRPSAACRRGCSPPPPRPAAPRSTPWAASPRSRS